MATWTPQMDAHISSYKPFPKRRFCKILVDMLSKVPSPKTDQKINKSLVLRGLGGPSIVRNDASIARNFFSACSNGDVSRRGAGLDVYILDVFTRSLYT